MKDWRVETLYALSPSRGQALERAATAEAACEFCGQPSGLWCRVSQKEFLYTPSPHMARKFGWLDLAGPEFALVLLDAAWTPNARCSCCGGSLEECPRFAGASATCVGGDCGCFT